MLLGEARLYYFSTFSFICLTYRPTDDGRPKLLRPLPSTITINHEKMATSYSVLLSDSYNSLTERVK